MIEAVLDTGFNGSLTLPPALIASLRLPWLTKEEVELADGRAEWVDVYRGTVVWDGSDRQIEIERIDGPILLGMALLTGYDLRVRVVVGGAVEIEAIP